MAGQRGRLIDNLNALQHARHSLKFLAEDGNKESLEDYNGILRHFDAIHERLLHEIRESPIGHRYTGTFYILKSSFNPRTYDKVDASAFMREDLVSWEIEDGVRRRALYQRNIFKSIEPEEHISREEGEAVYEKDYKPHTYVDYY